jgi:hypothetical protein
MKEWLSDGEWDIEFMESMGVITEQQVIDFCEALTDSPWYEPEE